MILLLQIEITSQRHDFNLIVVRAITKPFRSAKIICNRTPVRLQIAAVLNTAMLSLVSVQNLKLKVGICAVGHERDFKNTQEPTINQ